MKLADAKTLIIGAGVIGAAVAYHLARAGERDILVLDKGDPAAGTTIQSAGLIGQVRGSVAYTRLTMRSIQAFNNLIAAGFDPGWHPVGSLRLSLTPERDAEFARLIQISREAGLAAEMVSPDELVRRYPQFDFGQVRGAIWCSDDGYVEPPKLTLAYLGAARQLGASLVTGVAVHKIMLEAGRVVGVQTDCGEVRGEQVIVAAGTFAAKLIEPLGVHLPIIPVRHALAVSIPLPDFDATVPVVRVPDHSAYLRPEAGGVIVGGFERSPLSIDPLHLPNDFSLPTVPTNWLGLQAFIEGLTPILPALRNAQLGRLQKGWPTCTPDGEFIVGPLPEITGLVMAAGCNVHGVSGSAGIAALVVDALTSPPDTLTSPGRFAHMAWDWHEARLAAESVYGNYYTVRN